MKCSENSRVGEVALKGVLNAMSPFGRVSVTVSPVDLIVKSKSVSLDVLKL